MVGKDDAAWWRHAAVYQIYPRSFADANGDGVGDLAGVISRLDYLCALGVDAVWFTPWYVSPQADGGYDVADYRQIDPRFGNLDDATELIAQANARGIRTIIDIVPNHVSDQHPWFQAALAADPGSPERARFWFRDGKGDHGEQIPTTWQSSFRGQTWTRTTNPDGTPGQWYLHLFTPEQPDVNWNNPDVRAEHEAILKFWFDRGAAGVRVDSAALIIKDPTLPDVPEGEIPAGQHPFLDRDEIHDVYGAWRRIADAYDPPRILVGEVWLADAARFAAYLVPGQMHTAFNFDFMTRAWSATQLRASIVTTLAAHREVMAPATWVLSNHDVTRPVTRYGRADSSFSFEAKRFGTPTELELGTRRARAAIVLVASLPGSLYVYQGEELGLPEDEELPLEAIEDPMHFRSGGVDPGRDGCRVPLPWTQSASNNFGFSTGSSDPSSQPSVATASPNQPRTVTDSPNPAPSWLPQPRWWGRYAVDVEQDDPNSMLTLYRRVLALRRESPQLANSPLTWMDGLPDTVLGFTRDDICCLVNFGAESYPLPDGDLLMSSARLDSGVLGTDQAAWIRLTADRTISPRKGDTPV
ncbi:MAG: glycoside hydrolase family 13 protein [Propionibacteriaceae bacterium]|jgi:alpha-glucosidase|nr:glycoside hydrolase family 13 protein [Propionibacteriaceae bacterium]